jgi:hypothetical protein
MTLELSRTEPSTARVCRCPDAAVLAELVRTCLVEAVGEAFVSELHPFVVSPTTPRQLEAVLRVCAHHRLAFSAVSRPSLAGAASTCADVDVVLSLDTLIVQCLVQDHPDWERYAHSTRPPVRSKV